MRMLWELFAAFAKMGTITFGGGMAMLPILQREVVENKHWATEEEMVDYYAIGQCTPGIIAVNTATFVGQKQAGVAGGIAATLGVVFPSLVIITILAGLITNFSHLTWVQNAFAGIQVCVCVLIFNAVVKLLKKSVIQHSELFFESPPNSSIRRRLYVKKRSPCQETLAPLLQQNTAGKRVHF